MFHIRWVKQMAAYYDEKFYFSIFSIFRFFFVAFLRVTRYTGRNVSHFIKILCVFRLNITKAHTNGIHFAYIFQERSSLVLQIYGLTENYRNFPKGCSVRFYQIILARHRIIRDTHTDHATVPASVHQNKTFIFAIAIYFARSSIYFL